MKKILLCLLLFFCVVINVKAAITEEFNSGDWIPNIFINKVKNGTIHYRQARYIKRSSDGGIAYCIEPFEDMKTSGSYKGYDTDYASKLGINNNTWNRISQIAYYGYGYTNHTSDKWYAVTQVMIWREVDKNASFYFTDKLNGNKINTYDSEISEINKLISEHNKLPSFANKKYDFSINSVNTITDTNQVLNNYSVKNKSNNVILEKKNNVLTITTKDKEESEIVFERMFNKYNKKTIVFVDSTYQNLMTPGNIESKNFKISLEVKSGQIKVIKVDAETKEKVPQGEGKLEGTTYELYNEEKQLVDTLVIGSDSESISKELSFGKYILKETKNMKGYYLDEKEYEININNDNLNQTIIHENKPVKSKLIIVKYYDKKLEQGINFEIYNSKGDLINTLTTNEDGQIETELYYGKYRFHQINSTKNYLKVDDFEVIINEESDNTIRMNLYDEKYSSKLVILKKDSKTSELIEQETVFKIYDINEKQYVKINNNEELKTANGKLVIEKLYAGEYEIEEYKAPKGYKRKTNKLKISIDDEINSYVDENNYPVYEIDFENEEIEIEVPDTNQECNNMTYYIDKKKKLVIFS